jgi:chemotaxis protein methyltransferase CheR
MTLLSRKAFEAVTQLFHEASGIRLGDNKEALVVGRLNRLAQEHGVDDLEAYVERLVGGHAPAAEMTRVIDRLTTNETYFFREPQHFNDLAERLQSQWAADGGEFSVWSAASSSGEEAYRCGAPTCPRPWWTARAEGSTRWSEPVWCRLTTCDASVSRATEPTKAICW